ncbi:hypothetical protein BDA96_02G235700 [Sorghum bicolor]|uniref:Uncharacterized protein n=1 Tax=Sorghum bicolor TaxID=4558 RepID=A0A921RPS8_SORBI|nr:hypothetical protein BDA96_02G235700 [Sorghum bicolor]
MLPNPLPLRFPGMPKPGKARIAPPTPPAPAPEPTDGGLTLGLLVGFLGPREDALDMSSSASTTAPALAAPAACRPSSRSRSRSRSKRSAAWRGAAVAVTMDSGFVAPINFCLCSPR